jgi:hypothetical protein
MKTVSITTPGGLDRLVLSEHDDAGLPGPGVLAHTKRQLRNLNAEYDVAVFGRTHKLRTESDNRGDF